MPSDPKRNTRFGTKRLHDDGTDMALPGSPNKKVKSASDSADKAGRSDHGVLTPPPSSPIAPSSPIWENSTTEIPSTADTPISTSSSTGSLDTASDAPSGAAPDTVQVPPLDRNVSSGVLLSSQCNAEWPLSLREQMKKIVTSSDELKMRYNISAMPTEGMAWVSLGKDTYTQHLGINNEPLRFWIVGEVVRTGTWLIGKNGQLPSGIAIRIRPIHIGEYDKWEAFMKAFGGVEVQSSAYPEPKGTLIARKQMTYWTKSQRSVAPFNDFYDATASFKTYSSMEKWPTSSVGANDVVLLEVHLTRWMCEEDGKGKYKGEWKDSKFHRVGFELCAASMLFIGPDEPVPDAHGPGGSENFEF
ncbi:uncharacterized protein C8Q71DRAFT_728158 [Rhodofomes roseus]|uniref:Uncharacterized protein n=1 Tax=Rhodofomes roseus TaxID=34475 RepID=A0ABQ8JZ25_9APHY|nr:uncharacterized protein C8Q71DRAFT_728158 [Rhodofomes roseus]KAH9829286.1 hypothetical protein C8Q71DRAFT_728158 [Rhodofomes roseus]